MASFVELDHNNMVIRGIVVNNQVILDAQGQESEELGIAFCKSLYGEHTKWKQTSRHGNFRKNGAGFGYTYNEALDAFIPPKPFNSWILNEGTCQWEPPVPMPTEKPEYSYYQWNEEKLNWDLIEVPVELPINTQ